MLTSSTWSHAQEQEQNKQTTTHSARPILVGESFNFQKWVMKLQLVTELFESAKKGHPTPSYKPTPPQTLI